MRALQGCKLMSLSRLPWCTACRFSQHMSRTADTSTVLWFPLQLRYYGLTVHCSTERLLPWSTVLPGLAGSPLKSQWKFLWPPISSALYASKTSITWAMPRSDTNRWHTCNSFIKLLCLGRFLKQIFTFVTLMWQWWKRWPQRSLGCFLGLSPLSCLLTHYFLLSKFTSLARIFSFAFSCLKQNSAFYFLLWTTLKFSKYFCSVPLGYWFLQ